MLAMATDTSGLAANCCAKDMEGDAQLVGPPRGKSWSDQFGESDQFLAERFAPHLDYISCSLFLENGDAVLQTIHLLAGIAHCLAIGQLIRDDDV